MDENEKIVLAQDWIRKLANGTNPLNGNPVKEDDIVNNVHISRCLFYVADLLVNFSDKKKLSPKSKKEPFEASSIQIDKYIYVDAITISAFTRKLQKMIPENMRKLNYKLLVQWLVREGMLIDSEPDIDGRIYKIATEKGREIGIYTEKHEKTGGHFLVTLYNRDAQYYLLKHLEVIISLRQPK